MHIFSLNDDGPSMLTLEEDEELSAANSWLLPAGGHQEIIYSFDLLLIDYPGKWNTLLDRLFIVPQG